MRWLWLPILAGAAFVVVDEVRDGSLTVAVAYGALGLALSWWLSPWQGGLGARHADVERRPASEHPVVIYWRPGCIYCLRLRCRLRRAGRHATWVNIWRDEEAAAFVRSVNDGNETVPTVLLDHQPFTNPAAQLVLDRLRAR
jgi:mycoredoxin